mmetsp:Transcript_55150/g.124172  ORF Transcript_55150/g.124172 Transcript_55150/m.124172 type:complete len:214 (+) Transcript_55150:71-712(+)
MMVGIAKGLVFLTLAASCSFAPGVSVQRESAEANLERQTEESAQLKPKKPDWVPFDSKDYSTRIYLGKTPKEEEVAKKKKIVRRPRDGEQVAYMSGAEAQRKNDINYLTRVRTTTTLPIQEDKMSVMPQAMKEKIEDISDFHISRHRLHPIQLQHDADLISQDLKQEFGGIWNVAVGTKFSAAVTSPVGKWHMFRVTNLYGEAVKVMVYRIEE